jgi:trk system potassium uptake protein
LAASQFPPATSPAPPLPRKATGQGEALLLAAMLLLAADFALPMRGRLSLGLLALLSLLGVPWILALLRLGNSDAERAQRKRALLFHGLLIALLLGFLGAKWWLQLVVGAVQPELFVSSSRSYCVALLLVLTLGVFGQGLRVARFAAEVAEHPARLMALSFGATGLLGAFLLSLPVSVQTVRDVSFVDNLFTSFSALCVTGLAVNVVPEAYTLAGQIVICALIQVGGLGIMVLSAAVSLLAGQRMRVKSSAVLAEMVDTQSLADLKRVVLGIVSFTLVIESVGVVILVQRFGQYPEVLERSGSLIAGPGSVVWAAIFHTVSAFGNAGFSNCYGGLVPFVGDVPLVFTMAALIILGGIGFPVLDELVRRLFTRLRGQRPQRMSLHTRIVLRLTALLLLLMTVAYLLEWNRSMKALGPLDSLVAAFFQSASARTAGFNVIDIGAMGPAVLMLTCVAMFIGASPGGTGGGVKTTSLAALFAGLRGELEGRAPKLLDRVLPATVIRKAMGVSFLSIAIVSASLFLLLLTESHGPLELAFEAFSAFSTTGLSTGITPKLTVGGKLLITMLMFIGRIGPLTLALALAKQAEPSRALHPEERVMIG